jgi:hypothetical protein
LSETVENKPHKARDPPSAGIVQPKGAVEGSCLTFAATFIVRLSFHFRRGDEIYSLRNEMTTDISALSTETSSK